MVGILMVVGMATIGLAWLNNAPWLLAFTFITFVAASVVDNAKSY